MTVQSHMQHHMELDGDGKDVRNVRLLLEMLMDQIVQVGHLEGSTHKFSC